MHALHLLAHGSIPQHALRIELDPYRFRIQPVQVNMNDVYTLISLGFNRRFAKMEAVPFLP